MSVVFIENNSSVEAEKTHDILSCDNETSRNFLNPPEASSPLTFCGFFGSTRFVEFHAVSVLALPICYLESAAYAHRCFYRPLDCGAQTGRAYASRLFRKQTARAWAAACSEWAQNLVHHVP